MPRSLALSVTTGGLVISQSSSPPIEKGIPRHGGRFPRFVTGSSCPMIRRWLPRGGEQSCRPFSSAFQAKDAAHRPSEAV